MTTPRRTVLRGLAAGALALPLAGTRRPAAAEERPAPAVHYVDGGDIFCIVGDTSQHGLTEAGDLLKGLPGVWAMMSRYDQHNAFVSGRAGLVFSEFRNANPLAVLRRLDRRRLVLERTGASIPTFSVLATSRMVYTVRSPDVIDLETTFTPLGAARLHVLSWTSYINAPEDPDIFIRFGGAWVRAHSPVHGVNATYAPVSLVDIERDLRYFSAEERKNLFILGYSDQRYDQPLFYGRIRDMVAVFMFDRPDDVRILISPSGGGASILPGRTNPAWDWWALLPNAPAGVEQRFRARMVYKRWEGEADVLRQFDRWNAGISSSGDDSDD